MKNLLLTSPRWLKQLVAIINDILCAILATWLAYSLRLEEWVTYIPQQKYAYISSVFLSIPIFIYFGVYKTVLRFVGAHSIALISKAVVIYGITYFALIYFIASPYIYRSIGLVQPFILFTLMAITRIIFSIAAGFQAKSLNGRSALGSLLIYGAGQSGMQISSALRQSGQYYLVGYIDDSPEYLGTNINGLMVYAPDDIPRLISTHGVTDILLAMPSISRSRRNQILQELGKFQVHVRSLPDLVDLAKGRVTVLDIKELEPDDLLGRNTVDPDDALMSKNILNKVVLVSGAGGSIGSELCRQIIKYKPSKLLLLDHSEFNLYSIEIDLRSLINKESSAQDTDLIIPILANVRDIARLEQIFNIWKINTVYHAAAYKHVPLVESNPIEGIENNVFGTLNIAMAARSSGVSNFVLISTDKAVRPTNIMGATKRLAELILQALSQSHTSESICYSMVRFGNVLGSSGSVVPLFRDQIKIGGPVTVTHKDVTRYFMTIPEAAQLVIQAGALAKGGEVFVLDMGDPIKILDFAKRMIQLSGLTVRNEENQTGDIEIIITGLRPGEKLYEELLIGESPMSTSHPKIKMAHESFIPYADLMQQLKILKDFVSSSDVENIIKLFQKIIHGYSSR